MFGPTTVKLVYILRLLLIAASPRDKTLIYLNQDSVPFAKTWGPKVSGNEEVKLLLAV